MRIVREITRYIGTGGIFHEPRWEEVLLLLVEASGAYYIRSPWAMRDAPARLETTDALDHATGVAPHWHNANNASIRDRLLSLIRHEGNICGPSRLADLMETSETMVFKIARGEIRASAKLAGMAQGKTSARA